MRQSPIVILVLSVFVLTPGLTACGTEEEGSSPSTTVSSATAQNVTDTDEAKLEGDEGEDAEEPEDEDGKEKGKAKGKWKDKDRGKGQSKGNP